jgi:ferredoxin-NADP reductase/Na+-transporting NADH:ubiquinone oxidoreductase subunit NqrB
MHAVDSILNKITMYRVVLYYLIGLIILAVGFSAFHLLAYDPVAIVASSLFLFFFGAFVNDVFSVVFKAPVNVESAVITALILALIVPPPVHVSDFLFLGWVSILANASKYILAIGKKHIFNPVAVSVALTGMFLSQPATWWVGNTYLSPFVLLGGILVARKIRREKMVISFLVAAAVMATLLAVIKGSDLVTLFNHLVLHSSYLFLAFAMLTEPLTAPHTQQLQIIFGALVGILFVPDIHVGDFYSTPEIALMVGNLYAFLVSPREKLMLYLKERVQISPDTIDLIFAKPPNFSYVPGQYMEWTMPHDRPDDRGNRRYFTLASSPTEDDIRIGVKLYQPSSTFKKALSAIEAGQPIVAGQRAGDFVLPRDPSRKLVFIAGGIGITPFRSMLTYLSDRGEKRDIILFYTNKSADEIVYEDVIGRAFTSLGIRVVHTLTDRDRIPPGWRGESGRIDAAMVARYVPDIRERIVYISGPNAMVDATRDVLLAMGVPATHIRKDFFPGFA